MQSRFIEMIRASLKHFRNVLEVECWKNLGRPVPPPHAVKTRTVLEYAQEHNIDTFVETGTYLGQMIGAVLKKFRYVYSVELDEVLYRKALIKFSRFPHVLLFWGSSERILAQILPNITKPALFWLDAHYSGGITAKGDLESPIEKELELILNHPVKEHVILIDDARCFNGLHDYPSLKDLIEKITRQRPDLKIEVIDDIIRIEEASPSIGTISG